MSIRLPRLAAAALLVAGALTVVAAAPAFAEDSPTNDPIANADSYGMMGGTTLVVDAASGLLANDLHAASWTLIQVHAVQNDVPGELVLDGGYGGFSYTPAAGFVGERTFEYQVLDWDLGAYSTFGLVTITVLDPTLPCAVGTPGCTAPDPGPGDLPCEAGMPGCDPTDLPPCDPNAPPMEVPAPGTPPTCIPGDPVPGDGPDIPCAVGTPGCLPGEPTSGDGDIPCAVGTPGCTPPPLQPCDPNELPHPIETAEPCIPADIPVPTDIPVPSTDGSTGNQVQLETLAYTGSTGPAVDGRLIALAALLLVGGTAMVGARRRSA